MIATASAISEAHQAFSRTTPSSTNSVSSGKTAKIEVNPSEWETGSRTCLYISSSRGEIALEGQIPALPGGACTAGGSGACAAAVLTLLLIGTLYAAGDSTD